MQIERFFFDNADIELEVHEDKPTQVTGYAMKFGIQSHDRGGYRDVFHPDVFGESITGSEGFDVKAYYDHDDTKYLARTNNGSLRLETDKIGLKFSFDLPDTQNGRDVHAMISREDIAGMSFGYIPDEFRWTEEKKGPVREHLSGTLVEVSVVHDPAFPKTSIALASLEQWKLERAKTPKRDRARRLLKLAGEKFDQRA